MRHPAGPSAYHPRAMPVRIVLPLALLAALFLVAAELTTIASVEVAGESCEVINDSSPQLAERCALSGWERHGGAMLLLGLLAAAAGVLSRRWEARPSAAILIVVGAIALAITLIGDLPETGETGAIGRDFEGATAQAGLGFFLELTGALLCLLAGTLGLSRPSRRDAGPAAADR